jgi:2-succinyl-6-hydroxy-2,4-cyclohexadiene-1-carboxylate synthase
MPRSALCQDWPVRLAFEVAGDGSVGADPVTFLHGFSQGGAAWREVVELLPKGRYRCVLVDLRGHGASQLPVDAPHTLEACSGDLVRLWDHLGMDSVHLVGYSMGGRLALYVASRHPDRMRSLLTIGAHAGLEGTEREQRRRADEELAARIEQQGMEWFVENWQALPMFRGLERRGPAYLAALRALRLRNRPQGLAASMRGMGPGVCEPFWPDLAGISCPATFVAGGDDHRYVQLSQRLSESVPNGRPAVIEGSGHSVHMEMPQVFADLLHRHLSNR